VPQVGEPRGLGDAITALPEETARCLLAADGSESLVGFAGRTRGRPLALLIGPEGVPLKGTKPPPSMVRGSMIMLVSRLAMRSVDARVSRGRIGSAS
jgi:hypothetical protein